MTVTNDQLRSIRDSVRLVGKLSDGIVKLGPWGIGLDGVLSWFPVAGEVYSVVAGLFILVQGLRARVPLHVLAFAAVLLGLRTFGDALPLAGPLFADLFLAHRWAAGMVVADIERRLNDAPRDARWWSRSSALAA